LSLHVSRVDFTDSSSLDQQQGLLGWAAVQLNGALVIDGVAVRRTRQGNLVLSLPVRVERSGRKRAIVRIEGTLRAQIEHDVIAELERRWRCAS
jgi:DNA-binding cell septation regulator SpoVG